MCEPFNCSYPKKAIVSSRWATYDGPLTTITCNPDLLAPN